MENMSYDALVELITKEVTKILSQNSLNSNGSITNYHSKEYALIVGNSDNLPQFLKDKYTFISVDEYKCDIERYDCVILSKLTFANLADCALGRDADKVSCAVTQAFLNGKKVYLCESSLPHREFAGKADRNFFKMFEGYVNTLRSFGAEFIPNQWYGKNLDCNAIEDNTYEKVITEKVAKTLCEKSSDGTVRLRKGTVITPSAKDIFNHSEITVEFV